MSTGTQPRIPMDQRASIAVDLGAESCRVSLLRWLNAEPVVTLVYRFANKPVEQSDGMRWPLTRIIAGVEEGIRRCAQIATEGVRSLAVDGWGVDYVRLDDQGTALAEPFCYRDERTKPAQRELHRILPPERLRELTGVQQLPLNTLYQLYADRLAGVPERPWLQLPEYVLTRLGAAPVSEYTNATHSEMIDLHTRQWSAEIFTRAGLDVLCAPRLVSPGTRLGRLRGELAALPALRDVELIAPACHDTASAIAGIPDQQDDWAYISSGTWSLVGAVTQKPINDSTVRADNFTNLGAIGGAYCFHKSVNGMWLLKQCLSAWEAQGVAWDYAALLQAAATMPAPEGLLDVDEADLMLVGEMPQRINRQRVRRGLEPLDEAATAAPAFAALILRSLAARYAEVLHRVQQHTGRRYQRVYIVGGGNRNAFLNLLTAEATGFQVVCGSAESATIGNFAIQLAALERQRAITDDEGRIEVARWAALLQPA